VLVIVFLLAVMRAFSLSLRTVRVSGSMTRAVLLADARLQTLEFSRLTGLGTGELPPQEAECGTTQKDDFSLLQCSALFAGGNGTVTLRTYQR
jgi:hypothetical protein